MSNVPDAGNDNGLIDFYDELSFDRDSSLDDIQTQLTKMTALWSRRAARSGDQGDAARLRLAVVEQAKIAFADEESKERYDVRLRGTAVPAKNEATVDWVARAQMYYDAKDHGAAQIAARKARQYDGDNVDAYVISAWIEIALNDSRAAEAFASEAYVLDAEETSYDVLFLRGVVFSESGKWASAAECFKNALVVAPLEYRMPVSLNIATSLRRAGRNDEALDAFLLAMELDDPEGEMLDWAVRDVCAHISEHWVQRDALEQMRRRVLRRKIDLRAKNRILQFIDIQLRVEELQKQKVPKAPEGPRPAEVGLPWKSVLWVIAWLVFYIKFAFDDEPMPFLVFLVVASPALCWLAFTYCSWRKRKSWEIETRKCREAEEARSQEIQRLQKRKREEYSVNA